MMLPEVAMVNVNDASDRACFFTAAAARIAAGVDAWRRVRGFGLAQG